MSWDKRGIMLPLVYTTSLYGNKTRVVGKAVDFGGEVVLYKTTPKYDLMRNADGAAGFDVRVADHLSIDRFVVCVLDGPERSYYSVAWPPDSLDGITVSDDGEGLQFRVPIDDREAIPEPSGLLAVLSIWTTRVIDLDKEN
jgi:hypothetical protein